MRTPENVHLVCPPLFTYCSVGATIKYKDVSTLMCDVHKTVMDSQEIWNILREESEARLARMEMSHSWHTVIEVRLHKIMSMSISLSDFLSVWPTVIQREDGV